MEVGVGCARPPQIDGAEVLLELRLNRQIHDAFTF